MESNKRNSTIEVEYGFHSWFKLQPCFPIGGDHWIIKRVIIWLHRKGGGSNET